MPKSLADLRAAQRARNTIAPVLDPVHFDPSPATPSVREEKPELDEFDPLNFEPVKIGPTWQTTEDGFWLLPEYSLGWDLIAFAAEWFINDEGDPWKFTDEQTRFVLWLYAVDENGKFLYSTSVLQRLKGWGKDPLAVILCLLELIGPVRFSHWDSAGNPIGREHPNPLVLIAAVSKSQALVNTMPLFPVYVPLRTERKFRMDIGNEIIRARGGRATLRIMTAAARSAEGARATFVIENENHLWVPATGGVRLHEVIVRNTRKAKGGGARILAITNAYQPGDGSVLEALRKDYMDTVTINPATGKTYSKPHGMLYDSLEAPANAPLTAEAAPFVLAKIRGDAVWLDIPSIVEGLLDMSIPMSVQRRFWYNQVVANEEAMVAGWAWDAMQMDANLKQGDEVVMAFDGGKTMDATVLLAVRVRDRFIQVLGIWQRPPGPNQEDWEVPRAEVDFAVNAAFKRFKIVAFFADVHPWESYIVTWDDKWRDKLHIKAKAGRSAIGYDMTGNQEELTAANEALVQNIYDGIYRHDGNAKMREHIINTRRRYNKYGLYFGKDDKQGDTLHNDGYAALLLASVALTKYLESGKKPARERTGRVHFLK